jgi:hypothetical protein
MAEKVAVNITNEQMNAAILEVTGALYRFQEKGGASFAVETASKNMHANAWFLFQRLGDVNAMEIIDEMRAVFIRKVVEGVKNMTRN